MWIVVGFRRERPRGRRPNASSLRTNPRMASMGRRRPYFELALFWGAEFAYHRFSGCTNTTTKILNFPKLTHDRLAASFKETNFNVPKVATGLSERRR